MCVAIGLATNRVPTTRKCVSILWYFPPRHCPAEHTKRSSKHVLQSALPLGFPCVLLILGIINPPIVELPWPKMYRFPACST